MRKEEKKIINSIDPASIQCTKIILEQMMKCVCKIKIKGMLGTGFFCKIPMENNIQIKCLLTNNHIIHKEYFQQNKKINLLLNDEKDVKIIDLNKKREKYFSEEYDVALIEIIETDKIENYLELDDNLFQKETNIFFEEKSVYIIQYQNGKNATVSYGLIKNIDNNNNNIKHSCNTNLGSSGSPILNLSNNKLIGIHKYASYLSDYNISSLLKIPLNEFIEKIKEKKNKQNINNNIFRNEIIINDLPIERMKYYISPSRFKTRRMNNINYAPNFSKINIKNSFNINNEIINILFQNYETKICVSINYRSTIKELINKYFIKSGNKAINTVFVHNNQRICPDIYNKSIYECGLSNSTVILVLNMRNVCGALYT